MGRLRSVGQAQVDDRYFIQRLYIGVEPEEQTSRELKDRYGVFAYAVSAPGEYPDHASSSTRWTSMEMSSSSWRPRSTW